MGEDHTRVSRLIGSHAPKYKADNSQARSPALYLRKPFNIGLSRLVPSCRWYTDGTPRALALDRNLATGHALIGKAKSLMGRGEETEAHINEALKLCPHHRFTHYMLLIAGAAKLQLSADHEAVDWLRRSIEANRTYPLTHFVLAAALALIGSLDEARAAARAGLALDPSFTIRRYRNGAPSDNPTYLASQERTYQGMRIAGVPTG